MNAVLDAVAVLAQVALSAALAPGLIGVIRTVRARLEGRVGAGVLQPYRDLRKLLRKTPVAAAGTSTAVMALAPLVLMGSSLVVAALVPVTTLARVPGVQGDLFVAVSFLLVGTIALAVLGLETGSAFGGMGSSRHMMIAALVEPTVLLSVYALSVPAGTSTLTAIVGTRLHHPATLVSLVSLLAIGALAVVVAAETGRLPIDNPATHLELTMIHEAMTLESSGRDLAWLEWASWLRLASLAGLVTSLLVPLGIATTHSPGALALGLVTGAAKILLAGVVIGVLETFSAKVRLFRVPELLAASFVLALLAVTAAYALAGVA